MIFLKMDSVNNSEFLINFQMLSQSSIAGITQLGPDVSFYALCYVYCFQPILC